MAHYHQSQVHKTTIPQGVNDAPQPWDTFVVRCVPLCICALWKRTQKRNEFASIAKQSPVLVVLASTPSQSSVACHLAFQFLPTCMPADPPRNDPPRKHLLRDLITLMASVLLDCVALSRVMRDCRHGSGAQFRPVGGGRRWTPPPKPRRNHNQRRRREALPDGTVVLAKRECCWGRCPGVRGGGHHSCSASGRAGGTGLGSRALEAGRSPSCCGRAVVGKGTPLAYVSPLHTKEVAASDTGPEPKLMSRVFVRNRGGMIKLALPLIINMHLGNASWVMTKSLTKKWPKRILVIQEGDRKTHHQALKLHLSHLGGLSGRKLVSQFLPTKKCKERCRPPTPAAC